MTLPTFIIIGAPKCGSSALYEHLRARDDVVMSLSKEPSYFGARHDRGLEWYRQQFVGDASHVGEASVGYLADPVAPERIAALLPDVKLIALVRNPFDRARSHYWWRYNNGVDARSFDDVLDDGEQAFPITHGLYQQNLNRYLKVFPRDALLVLTAAELQGGEAEARIASHLGLERTEQRSIASRNEATAERSAAVTAALGQLHSLRSLRQRVPEPVRRAGARVIQRTQQLNRRSFEAPPLTPGQVRLMAAHFHPDLDRLEAFLGRDLAEWRAPSSRA